MHSLSFAHVVQNESASFHKPHTINFRLNMQLLPIGSRQTHNPQLFGEISKHKAGMTDKKQGK